MLIAFSLLYLVYRENFPDDQGHVEQYEYTDILYYLNFGVKLFTLRLFSYIQVTMSVQFGIIRSGWEVVSSSQLVDQPFSGCKVVGVSIQEILVNLGLVLIYAQFSDITEIFKELVIAG